MPEQPRKPQGSPASAGGRFDAKQSTAPTTALARPAKKTVDPVAAAQSAHTAAQAALGRIDVELAQLQERRKAAIVDVNATRVAALKADAANVVAHHSELAGKVKASNAKLEQGIARAFHAGARPEDSAIGIVTKMSAEHARISAELYDAERNVAAATGRFPTRDYDAVYTHDLDEALEALEAAETHRKNGLPNLAARIQSAAVELATRGSSGGDGICIDCGDQMHWDNDEYYRCGSVANVDIDPPDRYRRW